MIYTSKILKAFNDKLTELYPTYKIYGVETYEGYKMPCFNTELHLVNKERANKNINVYNIDVLIDYLNTPVDTSELMAVADVLHENFSKTIKVGERVFHIDSFSQEYSGDYNQILTCVIGLRIYDNEYKNDITNPIEDVSLRIIKEERNGRTGN